MKKAILILTIITCLVLSACTTALPAQEGTEPSSNPSAAETLAATPVPPTVQPVTRAPSPTKTATSLPPGFGSPSIGDPFIQTMGNGGYDVQNYTIILDVTMATNEVKALTRIEAVTTQELSTFTLDFTGFEWDAVRVNGEDAAFLRKIGKLEITPANSLGDKAPFTVEVAYHGVPFPIGSLKGSSVGWFRAMDGTINVFTEPDGAYGWFPCNNHPRDKAIFRFEVTVDDPWIAAANGHLLETIPQDGRTTYIFELAEPMATYLATVNIDHYDIETMEGPNGVLIRNYFPADFPEIQRKNYDVIPEVMEFFNIIYGPYPSTVYGVLIMDVNATHCANDPFGDETQSLTIVCPDPSSTGIGTIVHEMAHEWFGDSVSIESWADLWLKEGMATYAGCLWKTRDADMTTLDACMKDRAQNYPNRVPVDQPSRNNLFCTEAYTGGALVYHSLHKEVGDEMFYEIVRTYLERYRGSHAGTDEFITLVNEVSGQDLSDEIRAWLDAPVIPE